MKPKECLGVEIMDLALAISHDKSWMRKELSDQAFDAHARTHINVTMSAAEYRRYLAVMAFENILKGPV